MKDKKPKEVRLRENQHQTQANPGKYTGILVSALSKARHIAITFLTKSGEEIKVEDIAVGEPIQLNCEVVIKNFKKDGLTAHYERNTGIGE